MYAGYLVEIGISNDIKTDARHPYTRALFSSRINLDSLDKKVESIEGVVPKSINPDDICRYHSRCKRKTNACDRPQPCMVAISPTHEVACHIEEAQHAR